MLPFVPTICASCAELLFSPAITQPHQHMQVRSRQTSGNGESEGEYLCLECESLWHLRLSDTFLEDAKLVDHKGVCSMEVLENCPSRFHCSGGALAACPVLATALLH